MKFLLLLFFCQASCISFSQPRDTANIDSLPKIDIYLKIKDVSALHGKNLNSLHVSENFFEQDFTLECYDSSYKIASFNVVFLYIDRKGPHLVSVHLKSPHIDVEFPHFDKYRLKYAEDGVVTIENVIVEKDGVRYKANSLMILKPESYD